MAALLTKISILPNSFKTMLFKFSTESFFAMSTPTPIDLVEREEANSLHLFSSRSQTTTFAPASESATQLQLCFLVRIVLMRSFLFSLCQAEPACRQTGLFQLLYFNKSITEIPKRVRNDKQLFLFWFHIKVTNFSKNRTNRFSA